MGHGPWTMDLGPWPQHDALRRSSTWAAGRPCSETASPWRSAAPLVTPPSLSASMLVLVLLLPRSCGGRTTTTRARAGPRSVTMLSRPGDVCPRAQHGPAAVGCAVEERRVQSSREERRPRTAFRKLDGSALAERARASAASATFPRFAGRSSTPAIDSHTALSATSNNRIERDVTVRRQPSQAARHDACAHSLIPAPAMACCSFSWIRPRTLAAFVAASSARPAHRTYIKDGLARALTFLPLALVSSSFSPPQANTLPLLKHGALALALTANSSPCTHCQPSSSSHARCPSARRPR
jgi:hypothetical protein